MSATLPQSESGLFQRLWARWRRNKDDTALPVRMPTATHGRLPRSAPTIAQLGIDQGLLWGMVLLPGSFDVGADRVEPSGNILIPAIDAIDIAQRRITWCRKHG